MNGVGFPEREFLRVCAMCGFVADPGYPWEENLRPLEFCPRDGTPLERLSCQSCGAPVQWERGGMSWFGSGAGRALPLCAYCGEPATKFEPRMRERPKKAGEQKPEATYRFVFGLGGSPMIRMVVAEPPAPAPTKDLSRACAKGKAHPSCTCAGCKSVRRNQRKRA